MALGSLRTTNRLDTVCAECNKIPGCNVLHNAFRLVCILTTIALVIWCCIEFNENEDVCEVSFKTFNQDEDSIYPDMIVVPKFESDISRILQISNIVGVPVSVRSEGRSYNLCQSVKPSKYTIKPNQLLNKEPIIFTIL